MPAGVKSPLDRLQLRKPPHVSKAIFATFDTSKTLKLVVSSLVLGVAGNWIYGIAPDKQARLELFKSESRQAGQTNIDLKVVNTGSFDLAGLEARFELERTASFAISPDELKVFAALKNNQFQLKAPASFTLKPTGSVEMRFTSTGSNTITNQADLPRKVSSTWHFSKQIDAAWESAPVFSLLNALIAFAFITLVSVIVLLIMLIKRLPPN